MEGQYNETLQCYITTLIFDGANHIACFALGGPCDMEGAIKLATAIDSAVTEIHTVVDGENDTKYTLRNGKWRAFPKAASCPLTVLPKDVAAALYGEHTLEIL